MLEPVRDLFYVLLGYLAGSVLFARVMGQWIAGKDVTVGTVDDNPGTANAFQNGGFLCGALTLIGDLLKGFLPVFFYIRGGGGAAMALVLAAPVLGHIFPVFYGFCGGKGIAVSFGCLLGLLPEWRPLAVLALFFILFSTVLRVTPHYHRTLLTYIAAGITLTLIGVDRSMILGFLLICVLVVLRLLASREEKVKCEVHLLWKR